MAQRLRVESIYSIDEPTPLHKWWPEDPESVFLLVYIAIHDAVYGDEVLFSLIVCTPKGLLKHGHRTEDVVIIDSNCMVLRHWDYGALKERVEEMIEKAGRYNNWIELMEKHFKLD